jgi:hypothetical protein
MLCQTLAYREVTALFSIKYIEGEDTNMEKDPWSKTLNWYFFAVANYYLYGESIIYYFKVQWTSSSRRILLKYRSARRFCRCSVNAFRDESQDYQLHLVHNWICWIRLVIEDVLETTVRLVRVVAHEPDACRGIKVCYCATILSNWLMELVVTLLSTTSSKDLFGSGYLRPSWFVTMYLLTSGAWLWDGHLWLNSLRKRRSKDLLVLSLVLFCSACFGGHCSCDGITWFVLWGISVWTFGALMDAFRTMYSFGENGKFGHHCGCSLLVWFVWYPCSLWTIFDLPLK